MKKKKEIWLFQWTKLDNSKVAKEVVYIHSCGPYTRKEEKDTWVQKFEAVLEQRHWKYWRFNAMDFKTTTTKITFNVHRNIKWKIVAWIVHKTMNYLFHMIHEITLSFHCAHKKKPERRSQKIDKTKIILGILNCYVKKIAKNNW